MEVYLNGKLNSLAKSWKQIITMIMVYKIRLEKINNNNRRKQKR